MNRIFVFLIFGLIMIQTKIVHSQLPDPFYTPPSNSCYYYKNKGQILDHLGNLRNDILYYTEKSNPSIMVMQDTISFWDYLFGDSTLISYMDTLRRIDLSFICKGIGNNAPRSCGNIVDYEESSDHLNYYLPHCGLTGITNVKGYGRIIYEDIFPNINFHLYSNSKGPKMYFEILPGGNPNDIKLLFSGQDSIVASSSLLSMYLGSWQLPLTLGYAYQISGGVTSPLGWAPAWTHSGGGNISISIGTYDITKALVIAIGDIVSPISISDNLDWSVYYGDAGRQHGGRLTSENTDKAVFHGLTNYAHSFPSFNGQIQITPTLTIGDWYISKFLDTERKWATYYGGSHVDQLSGIKVLHNYSNPSIGGLWAVGYTSSSDVTSGLYFPVGTFKQTLDAGDPVGGGNIPQDGLIASFDREEGGLVFNTYFGSQGEDYISGIDISPDNQFLYIVGGTSKKTMFSNSPFPQTTGKFPLYSGPSSSYYFKGNKVNNDDHEGFISRFNLKNFTLDWSTLFGGEGFDEITSVKAMPGQLYIGGYTCVEKLDEYPSPTTSHSVDRFPLSKKTGSYFQNSLYYSSDNTNSFISHFDSSLVLDWSSLLGHSKGGIHGLEINSKGDVYVLNSKVKSNLFAPSSNVGNPFGLVPTYDNGFSYFESTTSPYQRASLLKFNKNFDLVWGTKLHSFGTGFTLFDPVSYTDAMKIDEKDIVYIATTMDINAAPTYNLIGGYWQNQNSSAITSGAQPYHFDNYLLCFDNNDILKWGTYFGGASIYGDSYDVSTDLTINNGFVYLTGLTRSDNSPYIYCPYSYSYCDITYNATEDVFISRFKTLIEPNSVNIFPKNNFEISLFPNPVEDYFNISFTNVNKYKDNETLIIQVFNTDGLLVTKSELKVSLGFNLFSVDASGLAAGSYFISLHYDQYSGSYKFIKL